MWARTYICKSHVHPPMWLCTKLREHIMISRILTGSLCYKSTLGPKRSYTTEAVVSGWNFSAFTVSGVSACGVKSVCCMVLCVFVVWCHRRMLCGVMFVFCMVSYLFAVWCHLCLLYRAIYVCLVVPFMSVVWCHVCLFYGVLSACCMVSCLSTYGVICVWLWCPVCWKVS